MDLWSKITLKPIKVYEQPSPVDHITVGYFVPTCQVPRLWRKMCKLCWQEHSRIYDPDNSFYNSRKGNHWLHITLMSLITTHSSLKNWPILGVLTNQVSNPSRPTAIFWYTYEILMIYLWEEPGNSSQNSSFSWCLLRVPCLSIGKFV